jgi:signal transduction histidine kinase/predicted RNA-binding protein with RPS1 domain/ActR/RegA family two-component response regulator
MMSEIKQMHKVGQRVVGTVDKVLPYGVFVRLDDGLRAYLRRREMSWTGDADPRELVQAGQRIEAVISDLGGPDRSIELSRRVTLPDPWEEFIHQFQKGDLVEGTVRSLVPFGGFVQILPGVDGLVPLRELALEPVEKPEEVVWVGDNVEAVITHIDPKARKVRLSISARLRQRETAAAVLRQLDRTIEKDAQRPDFEALSPEMTNDDLTSGAVDPAVIERVGRILVVEDEDQVRLPLVGWLRNQGYEADAAQDAEEAEERIRQQPYGLLLVDIYLPGRDGLDLIQQIRERGNDEVRVAVMGIPEWVEKHAEEIEELDALEVFAKPLLLDEVERLLLKIGSGEPVSTWQVTSRDHQAAVPESFRALADATRTGTFLGDRLCTGLEQLVEDVRADAGAIFHLDPLSQTIAIEAAAGAISPASEREAVYGLEESPVRDVIYERELVFEGHMTGRVGKRFRKLLKLLPFESCIGVPIEVGGETQCALFLFHQEPEAFSRYRLRDALAAAILFAAVVERKILSQEAQSLDRLLLSGELAAGLGHEIYNKMSGLDIQLRNLQTDWRRLNQQTPDLSEHSELGVVQQAIDGLLETAEDLKRTVGIFQRLMRAGEEELDVNEVVRGAEVLLRPVARRAEVKVRTELDSGLPPVRGSGPRLQQVFLNVMLNAVQQMALISKGGTLRVTTSFEPGDGALPIKVRFSDEGPGIHKRLWEKIFALGFSTRPGGTGLGLFIARSLVESMGGRIIVERSVVPIGTTFLVELPAARLQEEAR